jgi:hypothetical protein
MEEVRKEKTMKVVEKAKLKSNLDSLLALATGPKENPNEHLFQMIDTPSSFDSVKLIEAWAKEHHMSMVLENADTYKTLEKEMDLKTTLESLYRLYGIKFLNEQRFIWVLTNYEAISPRLLSFYQPMIQKHLLPLSPSQPDIPLSGFVFTLGIKSDAR